MSRLVTGYNSGFEAPDPALVLPTACPNYSSTSIAKFLYDDVVHYVDWKIAAAMPALEMIVP